jgi:hypothetical protein
MKFQLTTRFADAANTPVPNLFIAQRMKVDTKVRRFGALLVHIVLRRLEAHTTNAQGDWPDNHEAKSAILDAVDGTEFVYTVSGQLIAPQAILGTLPGSGVISESVGTMLAPSVPDGVQQQLDAYVAQLHPPAGITLQGEQVIAAYSYVWTVNRVTVERGDPAYNGTWEISFAIPPNSLSDRRSF